MKYLSGVQAKIGDQVELAAGVVGEVVCSIDTNEYTAEFTRDDWSYLESGIMVNSAVQGLVHITEADEDLRLIKRAR